MFPLPPVACSRLNPRARTFQQHARHERKRHEPASLGPNRMVSHGGRRRLRRRLGRRHPGPANGGEERERGWIERVYKRRAGCAWAFRHVKVVNERHRPLPTIDSASVIRKAEMAPSRGASRKARHPPHCDSSSPLTHIHFHLAPQVRWGRLETSAAALASDAFLSAQARLRLSYVASAPRTAQ